MEREPKNKFGQGFTSAKDKKAMLKLANIVIKELKDLGARLHHKAKTGSLYIKFEDKRLRSLRICDHGNIPKYRYKWNIELGGVTRKEEDKGVKRFFYADNDLENFFNHIRSYQ